MRARSITPRRRRARGLLTTAVAASVALIGSLLVATPAAANVVPSTVSTALGGGIVKAAPVVGFDPENIISDALFYDGGAMTSAEIQAFLDAKIGTCSNGKCLNVLTAGISSRDAVYSQTTGDLICSAIQGGTMRVSELIFRVQTACGISAKTILVVLQKEQGLTTSKAPSEWNLTAAMGASCPDNAPCDPAFSGIGPQILKGTQQLKTYKAAAFGKQPGSHYIAYSPSSSCGGTTLNIRNYATAALYNYTPYQPNAAALAAGQGLGDSCSSYGNRNFFIYYTQWFGSTQFGATGVYNVGADIYFVNAGNRFHILPADWPSYRAAFGSPTAVSATIIQTSTIDAGTATRYLHNAATGVVAYLDGATTHRFATCALVVTWGGDCAGALTTVQQDVFTRLGIGPQMTSFARLSDGGRIHQIVGAELRPFYDAAAVLARTGSSEPYAAVLPPSVSAKLSAGVLQFAPGTLVAATGDSRVWLAADDGKLLYVPAFGIVDDLGLARTVHTVSTSDFAGLTQVGTLSAVVSCAAQTYIGASGLLYGVSDASGLTPLVLDAGTCGLLKTAGETPTALFLQSVGASEVYALEAGRLRHVTSFAKLAQLAGTSSPRILKVTAATLARFSVGPAYLSYAPGTLIQAAGDSRVWLSLDDGTALYVPSFGVIDDLGLSRVVSSVSAETLASLTKAGTLSTVVDCGGKAYIAASGVLYAFSGSAGFAVSVLGAPQCGQLKISSDAQAVALLQVRGVAEVFALEGGQARHVFSPAALIDLAGTSAPRVLKITAGSLAQFPRGLMLPEPGAGQLLQVQGDTKVWMSTGDGRLMYVPSFGIIDDLGLSRTVTSVVGADVAALARGSSLSAFVVCGGTSYFAAGGTSYAVSAATGLTPVDLGATTCAALRLSALDAGALFLRESGESPVYVVVDGRASHVTTMAKLLALAGTATPRVLVVSPGTLAQIPRGTPIS